MVRSSPILHQTASHLPFLAHGTVTLSNLLVRSGYLCGTMAPCTCAILFPAQWTSLRQRRQCFLKDDTSRIHISHLIIDGTGVEIDVWDAKVSRRRESVSKKRPAHFRDRGIGRCNYAFLLRMFLLRLAFPARFFLASFCLILAVSNIATSGYFYYVHATQTIYFTWVAG